MNSVHYFTMNRKRHAPESAGFDSLFEDSGGSSPVTSHVRAHETGLVGLLEAELDSRMNILNQTAMVTITDLYGTIMYANDLFCEISGYSRHEVIGRTHAIIRHPESHEDTVNAIWKLVQEGKTWQGIMKNLRRDRETFWARTTVAPVMDEHGKPAKCIWVRNDITDLKQTEQDLQLARQRADQQLLDNVRNASRIQTALLPAEEELRTGLKNSFLLFSPQQGVSGDFYWFLHRDDESIVVLGDGSGHGVSASFVSLIALTGLKYAAEEMGVTDPGVVLTLINGFLYRSLNKHKGSGLTETVDMSFCRYNHLTREFSYACAKSKIYHQRGSVVTPLERDEVSIGTSGENDYDATTRSIRLEKGDRIYLMSDGLADQFGGQRNKRLGSRHVRELLMLTGGLPIEEQKEVIRKNFLLWKGTNEQTDDLSLLAFQAD